MSQVDAPTPRTSERTCICRWVCKEGMEVKMGSPGWPGSRRTGVLRRGGDEDTDHWMDTGGSRPSPCTGERPQKEPALPSPASRMGRAPYVGSRMHLFGGRQHLTGNKIEFSDLEAFPPTVHGYPTTPPHQTPGTGLPSSTGERRELGIFSGSPPPTPDPGGTSCRQLIPSSQLWLLVSNHV